MRTRCSIGRTQPFSVGTWQATRSKESRLDNPDEIRRSLCEALVKLEEARQLFEMSVRLASDTREVCLGVIEIVELRAHGLLTCVETPRVLH